MSKDTMQVRSDLWLDQPDAHEQIETRLGASALTDDEAEKLHHFVDEGYLTVSLGLGKAFSDGLDDEISAAHAAQGAGGTTAHPKIMRSKGRAQIGQAFTGGFSDVT